MDPYKYGICHGNENLFTPMAYSLGYRGVALCEACGIKNYAFMDITSETVFIEAPMNLDPMENRRPEYSPYHRNENTHK
jgi:hypothetical protein